ncbi:MAG: cytochrome-c peroxidase [Gemmatimonadota bacterium]
MSRHLLIAVLAPVLAAACGGETALEPEASPAVAAADSRPLSVDPDVVRLGRALFFDARLSVNGNQSCASCHDPSWGWTGPSSSINAGGAVYEGSIDGAFGDRKPPSSAYATPSPVFHHDGVLFVGGNFWDGRATGERLGNPAAEQALGPFLNPAEQALAAPSDVVSRVCNGPDADLFRQLAGPDACDPDRTDEAYDFIGRAIAAFEASPESNAFSSKFDYFLKRQARLTAEEMQGFALFRGKGKCAACHVLDGSGRGIARGTMRAPGPLFTDFTFDNLGLPPNPENPQGAGYADRGLGGFLLTRADYSAYAAGNIGNHKVPTLRNVDLRPTPGSVKAYGHNGYFKSLEAIVHFYNTRDVKPRCPGAYGEQEALAADCWPPPEHEATMNRSELGNLGLTPQQERAIVAYLRTLTDGYRPR